MIEYSDTQKVIEECFSFLEKASREKLDAEKADRVAALFLVAQVKLAMIIQDIEMSARQSKLNVERVEGEKYFDFKTGSTEKKATENMLGAMVSKDEAVVNAKMEAAKSESELKKYTHILNVLKEGHLYFRNTAKAKAWSE